MVFKASFGLRCITISCRHRLLLTKQIQKEKPSHRDETSTRKARRQIGQRRNTALLSFLPPKYFPSQYHCIANDIYYFSSCLTRVNHSDMPLQNNIHVTKLFTRIPGHIRTFYSPFIIFHLIMTNSACYILTIYYQQTAPFSYV